MATLLITGAAGALGSHLVAYFLSRGDRVAAVDRAEAAGRLETLAGSAPDRCLALPLPPGPEAFLSAIFGVEAKFGPLHGAVLAAGAYGGGATLHESPSLDLCATMIQANFESAYLALGAILPGMAARRSGSVVLIGARPAVRPWTGTGAAAYTSSKAAVTALTEVTAAELAPLGVRVNAVLPSTLDTPGNRAAMPAADPAAWVSLDSLAEVISFLLGESSRDVSGALLPVYGRG